MKNFFEKKNHVAQFAVMFEEGIYNFLRDIFYKLKNSNGSTISS